VGVLAAGHLALWVAAYLVGGIPSGYLIGRARGIDIRQHGSGNIGATNVGRVLGKPWGFLVFLLDAGKCFALMQIAQRGFAQQNNAHLTSAGAWVLFGAGLAAIIGNVAPIYLKFRGGKAVAAAVGTLVGVWPYLAVPLLASLLVWIVVLQVSRYVSLASILAAAAYPLFVIALAVWLKWPLGEIYPLVILSALLAIIILVRHRANIARLLSGTEQKVGGPRLAPKS